jgi:N-acyl-D-amino-acid deacylase
VPVRTDLVIAGGSIVDGTGAPAFEGDVAVREGRIVAIGPAASDAVGGAARVIDAGGRTVTPGFIDIHTHSDIGVLQDPTAANAVRQGATTHVTGNCGESPAPIDERTRELAEASWPDYGHPVGYAWTSFADYLDVVEHTGVGINVAPLVGHGTVRLAVLGYEQRAPKVGELAAMRAHVDEAMRAGAFGLSTGLVYPPGCFGDTDEVVALAEIVAGYGGLYASHIRGERETVVEAVRECLEIGERAGCRVQVSHNAPKWGGSHLLPDVMALWDAARERGLDVGVDNDAHTDFAWGLRNGLPQWTHELGADALLALIATKRDALIDEVVRDARPAYGPVGLLKHEAWDRIWVLPGGEAGSLAGRTIASVARERRVDGWSAYLEVIVETRGAAWGLFDYIEESVVRAVASHPMVMYCSDGWVLPRGVERGRHPVYMPCSYGEFPGMLERWVVGTADSPPLVDLETAIRKMTSMPAARLGLHDRGRIIEGAMADLVVLDLPNVHDRATNRFPHDPIDANFPHASPTGIDWVLVNGVVAVDEGASTDVLAGRILRHRR